MQCISIFKCNPQIEVIDKSHCSLEDVPNFQNYSKSLEELFLDANRLHVLNDNVFKLTKLRRLSISDNIIEDIPPDIAKLVNLVELDCGRNRIITIPEQIKFLRGLQICDFSSNDIEHLPPGLIQLKNLTSLTLNYCSIKYLPDDFGSLKNLQSLEIREMGLEALPASFTNLESLKKLDLGNNFICELPEDIGRLTKLEYLLVDGNRLENVPPKIGRLGNLQCLDLGRQECGLKYLPEEIGGLTSLTDLHLSNNHLQSLPNEIGNLKSLTIFKADYNYLAELNPNIGGCTSLQELALTSNHITELPSSIGYLTDLRSLNADCNFLQKLPPQIGNLKRLGIISLRDNLLTHLPNEIGQLELVKVMDISGNHLEYLPTSITALNLKALWLSKNQAQPLPKLQIDELQNTGTKVLTCYLLPQQKENYSDQAIDANDSENAERIRQAAVSFDTAAIDDAELSNDAQFIRHDTPHPRELKARHQKLFVNTGKPELSGHDNASFSLADNAQDIRYDNDVQEPVRDIVQQSYQQPEYDSNGLPEVVKQIRPQVIKTTSSYLDKSNYPNHVEYNNNADCNNRKEPSHSYENGLLNNPKGILQQTDLKQKSKVTYRYEDENVTLSPNSECQVFDIVVRRSKNHKPGLGLSIAGGKDTPPYKDNDEGIFVSKVTRYGPAEAAGVKVGDKILAVNNNIFYEGITHQKAVDIFKKVKPDCAEFSMRILRDPNDEFIDNEQVDEEFSIKGDSVETSNPRFEKISSNNSTFTRTYTIPTTSETNGSNDAVNNLRQFLSKEPEKRKAASKTLPPNMSLLDNSMNKNIIYTTLVKDYKHDLGLVLGNQSDDNESRSSWSNIVITHIKPNSIASMDGKLQVDDRLLSINGADVTGIDLERIMLLLEGTERFIRIVVSRGDDNDPIGAALRNMPVRPSLGSWFSSTSNMSHRPSLIESYQRPTFGSVSSIQKQPPIQSTTTPKPPKPPKPSYLQARDSESPVYPTMESDPIVRPRSIRNAHLGDKSEEISDAEKRAAWRRDRLKSIEDDVEMAKAIAEAQRKMREEK